MNALTGMAATVLILLLLLAAYALGRRVGQGQGVRLGLALAPVQLRQRSLLRGRCLLCAAVPTLVNEHGRSEHTSPCSPPTQPEHRSLDGEKETRE